MESTGDPTTHQARLKRLNYSIRMSDKIYIKYNYTCSLEVVEKKNNYTYLYAYVYKLFESGGKVTHFVI